MTRDLRKAIVSIVMVLTFVASFLTVQPFVQQWGQAKVQEIAKAEKPGAVGPKVMVQAVIPQVFVVFGCLMLSALVSFIVAKKLPPADRPQKPAGRR